MILKIDARLENEAHFLAEAERRHLTGTAEPQTVRQGLAAIRMLFPSLVIGQIVPMNPATSVRGAAHSLKNPEAVVWPSAKRWQDRIYRAVPKSFLPGYTLLLD